MKKKLKISMLDIIILVIILIITSIIVVPLVINTIQKLKKEAFLNSSYGLVASSEYGYNIKVLNGEGAFETMYRYENNTQINTFGNINIEYKGNKPNYGTLLINDLGQVSVALYKDGYCITKAYEQSELNVIKKKQDECSLPEDMPELSLYIEPLLNGNDPILGTNMIPIIRNNNNTTWVKASMYNEWYNYENKKWANAVLVSRESRDKYKNASEGTIVDEADVLAYLVWIPRYKYKLFNTGTANYPLSEIEIVFESKNTTKSTGTLANEYLTHPAFTFGDDEVNGIWVGKFETTGTYNSPTIKPNITSLVNQNISSQYTTSLLFNNQDNYGLNNSDAHMMKNTEWGSVAYLSQSKYGKNSEVWINNSSNYITGCSGRSLAESSYNGCENAYYTNNGTKASTTGNIYGIYDMSGGAYESVLGALETNIGSKTPIVGYDNNLNNETGFKGKYSQSGSNQIGINLPSNKYIDIYNYTTGSDELKYATRILGDATSETRGWYNDSQNFVSSATSWFIRGGDFSLGNLAGIFSFSSTSGGTKIATGFRLSLIQY